VTGGEVDVGDAVVEHGHGKTRPRKNTATEKHGHGKTQPRKNTATEKHSHGKTQMNTEVRIRVHLW